MPSSPAPSFVGKVQFSFRFVHSAAKANLSRMQLFAT
ncbi:protein of unknown function (plasmid) [Azospirillum baldaniorum]|uniref:Uncharacterized protein n=1 Tax=Azospirillum baldaniorum TaxID=1064539 RepID=A0A9P1JZK2_9PROT|nr:protein of unknown function [Azospirillum baldaniorum]